jgi:hypothetical protein
MLAAADWFDFGIAAMERDVVLRFARAFGNNPGVAGSAVVTRNFGDEVVGSFGAFVHHVDEGIGAGSAHVSHGSRLCHRCRRGAPGGSDESFGAFLGIGNGPEGESESAEARDQEGFAIEGFHIFVFLFGFFIQVAFWATLMKLRSREEHAEKDFGKGARVLACSGVLWVEKYMREDVKPPGDEKLGRLLRAARPEAELPPGFQNSVWQRIERGEPLSAGILERLAGWFLTPRLATAAVAAVVLLAAGAGALRGIQSGEREARDRYVASVDPSYLRR